MDAITNTEDTMIEIKTSQENLLLEIIQEICSSNEGLSSKLKGKVSRIIADCDLTHHTSLHKMFTVDESTSTVLGFMQQTTTELTFEEQAELNQAIIKQIEIKMPNIINQLETLKQTVTSNKTTEQKLINELKTSLDEKLNTLQEQEKEKVELMIDWLNYKFQEVNSFSENSSQLLTIKTRILELKSKILHLQILQNIYTETNQSIKSYNEVHKDLKDTIKEMEHQIKNFNEVIESDQS